MKKELYNEIKEKSLEIYEKAHIILTDREKENLEVADFGLNDIYRTGLQIVTYVNTELCCAKEMVLLPNQTCPEHTHVPLDNGYMGKEETFRCRYGLVYLYIDGESTESISAKPPRGDEEYYTVRREIVLHPGDQFTLVPNTKHWFQAGPEGAVVSEFSTKSYDEYDIFTDPRISRIPVIE
ncbi:D-lyxose/D-mannose family sugar isomerase [Clostridium sp. BSD9I1]|uniref:D-lyxose/D-mannose family sugar isomerase n=1 Tax=Clostridium sp. BSD9I1 TaxID=2003589 RepID=UPI0016471046|nr:D-lyxose/D-mannose family sugar isomerase [Clostridium sp. BSD9I1]